ncbi:MULTISPECIES: glycosyltransferase [Flavobacteriaceae]|uniref:Glycosyltransferase n=1 Tax=Lutibacter litoralis TaxID=321268 RepID=A0ABV5K185_9FLAO|nr:MULTISPECIES: glycosyltransferase [Flavobacteriaceae]GGK60788.1 hypothetical protein GCM10007963_31050 [Lutibacter litoralis]
MKSPLVSVIITTYNRNKYLEECLLSIVNQSYRNIEVFVIDDGSDIDIAKKNKELCREFLKCNYYYKENSGQPDSRNYGIKKSKGNYIAFCDDDDYWVLDKLEKQIEILNIYPKIGLVSGCIRTVDKNSTLLKEQQCPIIKNNINNFEYLLIKNRIKSPTPLIRKEVFDKVGLFDTNYTIAEDWEFWRRVSYFYEFYNTNTVLAYVRIHSNNMTNERTGDALESFLLYRKLTKSLINWGNLFFSKQDVKLIYNIEYRIYRKLFMNHCPGLNKKIKLLFRIIRNDCRDMIHLIHLYFSHVK